VCNIDREDTEPARDKIVCFDPDEFDARQISSVMALVRIG
jgi:hypothetical protein